MGPSPDSTAKIRVVIEYYILYVYILYCTSIIVMIPIFLSVAIACGCWFCTGITQATRLQVLVNTSLTEPSEV